MEKILEYNTIIEKYSDSYFLFCIDEALAKKIVFGGERIEKSICFNDVFDLNKNILQIDKPYLKKLEEAIVYASDFKNSKKMALSVKSSYNADQFHWYRIDIIKCFKDNKKYLFIPFENIDDLVKEQQDILRDSRHDPVTGSLGKNEILHLLTKFATKENEASAYLIEVDGLDEIENSYGYDVGSKALKIFVDKLLVQFKDEIAIGRISNSQFLAIIKSEIGFDDVIEIAKKIRFLLNEIEFEEYPELKFTCSLGIIRIPIDGRESNDLIIKLKKALYRGIQKGRDCHVVYSDTIHKNIDLEQEIIDEKSSVEENDKLVSHILDTLINYKDINRALKDTINRLGKTLNLDRILIILKRDNVITIPFDYYKNDDMKKGCQNYTKLDWNAYKGNFQKNNTYSIVGSKGIKAVFSLYDFIGAYSVYQLGINIDGEFIGFISYESVSKTRLWNRQEILYFTIFGKIISDYIQKEFQEEKLTDLLYKDKVTGGWNLMYFKESISKTLHDTKKQYILVSFDISKFKYINQNYGYKKGDEILRKIYSVINNNISDEEICCRISDDRFLVFMVYEKNKTNIRIEKVKDEFIYFSRMIISADTTLNISAGGYIIDKDEDITIAIDKTNIARYYAKTDNLTFVMYDDIKGKEEKERAILERMDYSLANDEFKVYIQPAFDITCDKMYSAEALVRWDFGGKLIYPNDFIPIFEKNNFIVDLDFYVYKTVCSKLRKWIDEGKKPKPISVNVSRCHLSDERFIAKLIDLIQEYDLPAEYICVELTESVFVNNFDIMVKFAKEANDAGFKVYMDDFGVAYSTLSLLSKIHVDVIKLDKSFFDNDLHNEREKIIIKNIIRMAKELKIDVLSEGIETKENIIELKKLGCNYVQGYYYDKPMPMNEFVDKYLNE